MLHIDNFDVIEGKEEEEEGEEIYEDRFVEDSRRLYFLEIVKIIINIDLYII